MTVKNDHKKLNRFAQRLVVEYKKASGSPPDFALSWQPLWSAKVDRITINRAGSSSVAVIWFPNLRWDEGISLAWGDMVRIRTDHRLEHKRTVLFKGFVTNYMSGYCGGSDKANTSYERNAVACSDFRWLLRVTSPVFGQIARGPDDYTGYGTPSQTAISGSYTYLSGRRVIFNPGGLGNCDRTELAFTNPLDLSTCNIPIFCNTGDGDLWTARKMLRYVLSPIYNLAYRYFPIPDPNDLAGLAHADFDKVLFNTVADGLNVIEAVSSICRHVGWDFREDYSNDDTVSLVFFKPGSASSYSRSSSSQTILHHLYCPPAGESIAAAVAAGRKILWHMDLAEDIAAVINKPWGFGAPHRFEFTAELVPAWLDSRLEPDTSEDNSRLFLTEAALQSITDPNSYSYYKYYHPRGSAFLRDVGRKWALNEAGSYTDADTYDRGVPFDFADVIDDEYIKDADSGKRRYAPFNRQLLPCLTLDKDSVNSVGIKVEFSFDGGKNWQVITASISSLRSEAGIYINEANLAEMVDQAEGKIEGGALDGVQLNLWSSLCDDKLSNRSFKDGNWKTRVRVTASVQLDSRLGLKASPASPTVGSPFHHSQLYDFSEKYGIEKRTTSSSFSTSSLPAAEKGTDEWFDKHLEAIRDANQDMSISGAFTLERLWLGEGGGSPAFCLGDGIEKIAGREYPLSIQLSGSTVICPEICQIIYLPDKQKMKLITRDLRFAEDVLI